MKISFLVKLLKGGWGWRCGKTPFPHHRRIGLRPHSGIGAVLMPSCLQFGGGWSVMARYTRSVWLLDRYTQSARMMIHLPWNICRMDHLTWSACWNHFMAI